MKMSKERLERLYEYANVLEKLSNDDTVLTNEKLELIKEIKKELGITKYGDILKKYTVPKGHKMELFISSEHEGFQDSLEGPLKILVIKE